MDFGLSQDQILLKDTIHRWLDAECPTTRVRAIMETAHGHDPALWEGLAELNGWRASPEGAPTPARR